MFAVVGPYAAATLKAAGLETELEPLAFRKLSWRGIEVTVSRWGEHGGYEIWCAPDDAVLVWDRLMRTGAAYGIVPAGVFAMDVLDLEAGVPRPGARLQTGARSLRCGADARRARSELLIDDAHHGFNGRRALLAAKPSRKLVGLEIESDGPAPFTPLMLNDKVVGHTLRSVYSPALKRAIALATVDEAAAVARHAAVIDTAAQHGDARTAQGRRARNRLAVPGGPASIDA